MTVIDLKTGKEININENMRIMCAIGNFDGVHSGHRELLGLTAKKQDGITHSAVWTFNVHPGICMKNPMTKILTSITQKLELFRDAGIDLAILNDFEDVRDIPPEEFVRDVLYKNCHVRAAVCGFNFRFGKNAAGTSEMLKEYFAGLGVSAYILPPLYIDGEVVSSSLIRRKIEEGNVEDAARLLGHPFEIYLPVTEGRKLGRRIGIPTINQVFPENYAIPKYGVYACRCSVDEQSYIGISNVGVRPTVLENAENVNCETHIINFSGWLYGKMVRVTFYKFLRPETKFASLGELVDAIHHNIDEAVAFFK